MGAVRNIGCVPGKTQVVIGSNRTTGDRKIGVGTHWAGDKAGRLGHDGLAVQKKFEGKTVIRRVGQDGIVGTLPLDVQNHRPGNDRDLCAIKALIGDPGSVLPDLPCQVLRSTGVGKSTAVDVGWSLPVAKRGGEQQDREQLHSGASQ